jgi:hypothetical protein
MEANAMWGVCRVHLQTVIQITFLRTETTLYEAEHTVSSKMIKYDYLPFYFFSTNIVITTKGAVDFMNVLMRQA